jgi:hypothetical protein
MRTTPSRLVTAHRWRQALPLTLSLLIWPAMPGAQEVYKSVDAAGNVTYSDQPSMSSSPVDTEPGNDPSVDAGQSAPTAPPPLPTTDQPPCPEEGDLWTPGYWAWDGGTYYWVPGDWEPPPARGSVLDTRLLGLRWPRVRISSGLLGPARGLLRWHQLRFRVWRHRLRRRTLGGRHLCLQPCREQRECARLPPCLR